MSRQLVYGVMSAALLGGAGAFWPMAAPDYVGLDREAEPLRTTFNADRGKLRVVMLVAPT